MAAERVPGGFGSKLREARERRGVSLRQIANATKISVSALEALERNHVSRLPGGIFSRAFVRSYAIEVGLDPEETIQEFIAQFPNDSVTAGHPTTEHIEDNEALESHRRIASAFLRLVVISLPIVGIVMYYSAGGQVPPAPASQEAASERPVVAASEPPASPTPTPLELVEPAAVTGAAVAAMPAASPASRTELLVVEISAQALCWVSAVVDGTLAIQRELRAGEHETLAVRRELVLTVGDGAALALRLNGETARPLGRSGQVVTTRLNLSNFKDYLAAR